MTSSHQEVHVEGGDANVHVHGDPVEISMADVDLDDHGLVDQQEFNFLVTRTAVLEKQLKQVNENLSKVTNLLNDLVRGQAMGTSRVSAPVEMAVEPSPVVVAEALLLAPQACHLLLLRRITC